MREAYSREVLQRVAGAGKENCEHLLKFPNPGYLLPLPDFKAQVDSSNAPVQYSSNTPPVEVNVKLLWTC